MFRSNFAARTVKLSVFSTDEEMIMAARRFFMVRSGADRWDPKQKFTQETKDKIKELHEKFSEFETELRSLFKSHNIKFGGQLLSLQQQNIFLEDNHKPRSATLFFLKRLHDTVGSSLSLGQRTISYRLLGAVTDKAGIHRKAVFPDSLRHAAECIRDGFKKDYPEGLLAEIEAVEAEIRQRQYEEALGQTAARHFCGRLSAIFFEENRARFTAAGLDLNSANRRLNTIAEFRIRVNDAFKQAVQHLFVEEKPVDTVPNLPFALVAEGQGRAELSKLHNVKTQDKLARQTSIYLNQATPVDDLFRMMLVR